MFKILNLKKYRFGFYVLNFDIVSNFGFSA